MSFDRRVRHLGIRQVRTPFRSPRANAIAERWVKSARTECLHHLFVFGEARLRRAMSAYKTYYNHWRPHRSLCQRAPYDSGVPSFSVSGDRRQDRRRACTWRIASHLQAHRMTDHIFAHKRHCAVHRSALASARFVNRARPYQEHWNDCICAGSRCLGWRSRL
jgi:Integrase core domain